MWLWFGFLGNGYWGHELSWLWGTGLYQLKSRGGVNSVILKGARMILLLALSSSWQKLHLRTIIVIIITILCDFRDYYVASKQNAAWC